MDTTRAQYNDEMTCEFDLDETPTQYLIECKDGTVNFTHYPGQYAWRFMRRLIDFHSGGAWDKTVDFKDYLSVAAVQLLQEIFDGSGPVTNIDFIARDSLSSEWDGLEIWSHMSCSSTTPKKCIRDLNRKGDALVECLRLAIELDIRYDDEQETYCHISDEMYELACNEVMELRQTITSPIYGTAPHYYTMPPVKYMDDPIPEYKICAYKSQYIPIAILQTILDDYELGSRPFLGPNQWLQIASHDIVSSVLPFMYHNFSRLVYRKILVELKRLAFQNVETANNHIASLHPCVYSFIACHVDLYKMCHLPTYAKYDGTQGCIIFESTVPQCNKNHEPRMACPEGLGCALLTQQNIYEKMY